MSSNGNKLELPASIVIRDLALKIEKSPIDLIKKLMSNGVMATINQTVDFDTAAIVVGEYGFEAVLETVEEEESKAEVGEVPLWRQMIAGENNAFLKPRPPVVTILGHVDHGKTSLLDAIRSTEVAAGEAGGITQHIGAYQVEKKGRLITFLDTPGHAAFTQMRARGAQGADIVVLVVAADDGVMPQTREAIAHAKAARVPLMVALNKVDKANANPDRVKQQLAELELVPDEWGGNTMVIHVSAKQKQGIDDLLEGILLVADSSEIKANPNGKVIGTVIEAELDKSKGVLATLLVQNGTLEASDIVVAGTAYGKLRAITDYKGKPIKKAGPSTPVAVMGLSGMPSAGDIFEVVDSEKEARNIVNERVEAAKTLSQTRKKVSLEDLFANVQAGEAKGLNLIIKADVQGSLDPIIGELNKLGEGEIGLHILHAETGNISNNDVMLAAASRAIIIGFNVQADVDGRRLAEKEGVDIRLYEIIYRMTEDIEKALKGMLEPKLVEKVIGRAQVLAVFSASKFGKVAGCKVTDGELKRGARVRLFRGTDMIYEGDLSSLRHEKEDVKEIRQGYECGVGFKSFNDILPGDQLVCYIVENS
ncbi:MAG TPA: translation initiation factor IF-2 [Anaerolineales bacterium]|nr:translation initiation factor IF-2 [Anaerolineales bacterium]HMV96090.1 translation initiation factor IF-2 [Anaerolineales bacterium]HMX17753.1 translation initiation factor IF-2 [Anaerolineales bacterium]HMX75094.1 translation initiation factor IF-2 [Anaerolineales bacterium]HMZ43973.1 translation initiation factor IF-2 [Anaerolineales bacterium]